MENFTFNSIDSVYDICDVLKALTGNNQIRIPNALYRESSHSEFGAKTMGELYDLVHTDDPEETLKKVRCLGKKSIPMLLEAMQFVKVVDEPATVKKKKPTVVGHGVGRITIDFVDGEHRHIGSSSQIDMVHLAVKSRDDVSKAGLLVSQLDDHFIRIEDTSFSTGELVTYFVAVNQIKSMKYRWMPVIVEE